MKRKKNSLGLESIAFQSGLFFKELVLAIVQAREASGSAKSSDDMNDSSRLIENIIANHTGIAMTIEWGVFGPAVKYPDILRNHAFHSDLNRNYLSGQDAFNAIRKNGGIAKGTVDLKTSRVTGFFSELVSTLFLPFEMIGSKSKITPEELSAAILHEVGHVFVFFEYLSRTLTTNVILNTLSQKWADSSLDQRTIMLTNSRSLMKIDASDLDVNELATASKFEIVESVFASSVMEATKSELKSGGYDTTSFEYLADEFATRHGAGRHLVTMLDKIRNVFVAAERGPAAYIVAEVLKIALTIFPVTCGLGVFLLLNDGLDPASPYDMAVDRYRRVRQQLVEYIKGKNIPDDLRKQALQDIPVLDDIIAKYSDTRTPVALFVEKLCKWSATSKRRNSLVLQRELEELAFNNLYIKSAELSDLA